MEIQDVEVSSASYELVRSVGLACNFAVAERVFGPDALVDGISRRRGIGIGSLVGFDVTGDL